MIAIVHCLEDRPGATHLYEPKELSEHGARFCIKVDR